MFCKQCGKVIDDDSRFCVYCGSTAGYPDEHYETSHVFYTESLHQDANDVFYDERKREEKPSSSSTLKNVAILIAIIVGVYLFLTYIVGFNPIKSGGSYTANRFVGHWAIEQEGTGRSGDYPVQMVLKEDGTGIGDGMSINWYTTGDRIKMSTGLGTFEYDYRFVGGKLYLDDFVFKKVK